jgi:hypothetical protein
MIKYIVIIIIIIIGIGYTSNMVTLIDINNKRNVFLKHISTIDPFHANTSNRLYRPAYFEIGYSIPYMVEYKCGYSFGSLNAADKFDRSIYLFGVKVYEIEEYEVCG